MKKIGRLLRKEMKVMCAVKTGSILRSGSYNDMKNFKWETMIGEMKTHAPVLTSILSSCIETSKRNRKATIGVCASILFQCRSSQMSLLQKIIMLLLHASHCGKQVNKTNLATTCSKID